MPGDRKYYWTLVFKTTWRWDKASMPPADIEKIFLPLFESAGRLVDMVVFTRYESEGRLRCEVIAYFPPAAVEVAKAIEAEPCDKPGRAELGLLAGNKLAWTVLFTESE